MGCRGKVQTRGPNARKNLAKCRTRTLLGPVAFHKQSGILDAGWRSAEGHPRTIRQRIIAMRTSFYRYVGLWKSRHVSTRIKRTVFQAIRFFHDPVETAGIGENGLAQACFCGRGLQLHRQTENSERHHTQAQIEVPNTRIDHEEAKTEMVPTDAHTSKSPFIWQRSLDLSIGKRSQISDWTALSLIVLCLLSDNLLTI